MQLLTDDSNPILGGGDTSKSKQISRQSSLSASNSTRTREDGISGRISPTTVFSGIHPHPTIRILPCPTMPPKVIWNNPEKDGLSTAQEVLKYSTKKKRPQSFVAESDASEEYRGWFTAFQYGDSLLNPFCPRANEERILDELLLLSDVFERKLRQTKSTRTNISFAFIMDALAAEEIYWGESGKKTGIRKLYEFRIWCDWRRSPSLRYWLFFSGGTKLYLALRQAWIPAVIAKTRIRTRKHSNTQQRQRKKELKNSAYVPTRDYTAGMLQIYSALLNTYKKAYKHAAENPIQDSDDESDDPSEHLLFDWMQHSQPTLPGIFRKTRQRQRQGQEYVNAVRGKLAAVGGSTKNNSNQSRGSHSKRSKESNSKHKRIRHRSSTKHNRDENGEYS